MPQETAHAVKINKNNIVTQVIVIPYCNDDDDEITAYCNSIGLEGRWMDTSWTGARRGTYAGIGFTYDADADEFVAPAAPEVEAPIEP